MGGEAWPHAHTESVIGRSESGRGAANRVWEGRVVSIVRNIRCKGLHVHSWGKERLIPSRVRDGTRIISERMSGNNLGHCEGEEVTLWRGASCSIYSSTVRSYACGRGN